MGGALELEATQKRHEFREYDRKANIPFVPANVILPRVIFAAGEEEEPRMWEATMPAMLIIALAIENFLSHSTNRTL